MPFHLFTFLFFTVTTLTGCIEKYEADIDAKDTNLLVVEGTIYSGQESRFVLSRTQPIGSYGAPQLEMFAKVSVLGSDGTEYVAFPMGSYYSCRTGHLSPDVEYRLHIESDGEVYESEPQKPLSTEKIADVTGVQYSPRDNIEVLVTPEKPSQTDKANYYSWTYDETWEVHPEYTTDIYFDVDSMRPIKKPDLFAKRGWIDKESSTIMVGASTSYEGQHIQRLKLYDIDRADERLYHRYSGLVHQRAITKAEYEYEVARRQAGSEMGGLFTPLPSALPTNIHCLTSDKRAIGFVGCSLYTTQFRFFFNRTDFSVYIPRQEDKLFWLRQCNEWDCVRMVENGLFLVEWYDSRRIPGGGGLSTSWTFEYLLNVKLRGAYTEEPYFWNQKGDGHKDQSEDDEEATSDGETGTSDGED